MFHETNQKKLIAGLREYDHLSLEQMIKRLDVVRSKRGLDFRQMFAEYRIVTDTTFTLHTPKLSVLNTLRKSIKPGGKKHRLLFSKYDDLKKRMPAEVSWINDSIDDYTSGEQMILVRTNQKSIIKINATLAATIIEYSRIPVDKVYVTNSTSPIQFYGGDERVAYLAPVYSK